MDNLFQNFYRKFYQNTNGFIPSNPITQNLYPGDFFQIQKGEIIILGNIFRNNLIYSDVSKIDNNIQINSQQWTFKEGTSTSITNNSNGAWTKQILKFDGPGSFYFKGSNPTVTRIANWNEINQELIIKLTQTFYSFREVYVVTESATTSNWTLVIANSDKGELEIANDSDDIGGFDTFGHESSRTIQSKDLEFYYKHVGKTPNFFKAKKIVIQDEKQEAFINELINKRKNRDEWAALFFDNEFISNDDNIPNHISQNSLGSILDMLQPNELNPNTALLYFKWADTNFDDIEKLLISY